MADTTPKNEKYIIRLEKEIGILQAKVDKKQKALIRIYNLFDENMHSCQLKLNNEARIRWMQEIAKKASATIVGVKQVVDEPAETINVEVLKTKKPSKVVGVGMAGEKSGY